MTKKFIINRLVVTVFVYPSKKIGWAEVTTSSGKKLFYRAQTEDGDEAFMLATPKGSKSVNPAELDKELKKAIDMPLSRLLAYINARV